MSKVAEPAIQTTQPLKIVIVGHVDHGKSTLVGRLFHDTGSLPDGRVEAVRAMSEKRGMPFEWAFLLDALQAERDQGITIDISQIFFRTDVRHYVLIDAPGHREFVKNMITGAAQADAAVLVVDAKDGMQEQTRRHAYLLHLLGIHQIVVAINKMDSVEYSEARFQEVGTAVRAYLADLGIDLQHTFMIPVVARDGENIVASGEKHLPWYTGPTLAGALDLLQPPVTSLELPLRMPVQDVYKFDDRRIIAGRIESGHLRKGDTLLFSPSNKKARIASIEAWNVKESIMAVRAGESVGFTLDEQIFVERGEICSLTSNPPMLSNVFRGRIFWLGREPLVPGARLKMKLCTGEYQVEVEKIEKVIDTQDLGSNEQNHVERNAIAEVVLRSRRMMALDPFDQNMYTGRFVLVEDYEIVGGGLINMDGYADQRLQGIKSQNIFRVEHRVPIEERWKANGHKGGILWMTGLSGAGKSTLAFSLEQHLFRKGYLVYVLDGDNVRHGLCSDLGFSPQDRVENIRRVGHAAGLFARAGFLVLTAFISPYRADRDRVRAIAPDVFHEVHIDADLSTCETRDPKGLYKKARKGEIHEFTGVSAPYEPPSQPELRIDSGRHSIEECLAQLDAYVSDNFVFTRH
ncbi:MAG: adenylyl-sulfate kinase [Rhodospirillales bacterium]|nr:adenylyl-sulfate kinase [Rhodospirillales bacterium]